MTDQQPLATVLGIEHINIKSRDIQRSIDFYTNVLGLRLVRADRNDAGEIRFAALRAGQDLIDLVPAGGDWDTARGGFNHVALLIEPADLEAVAARCREMGIPITEGPVTARQGAYGMGRAIYIQDPDGHGIELKHYEQPAGLG